MDHRLVEGLMEVIAPLIKTYVEESLAKQASKFHGMLSAVSADLAKLESHTSTVEEQKTFITAMVSGEVTKAVAFIDKPVDGKSVTIDEVRPLLEEMVAALPVAQNGKDADPEVIASVVAAEVARALPVVVSTIPIPQNGKDADPEAMKSAVIDVVADMLPGEVFAAVSAIEKPKDGQNGKDADPELIRALVTAEVAKIDPPKDGKDGEPGAPGHGVDIQDLIPTIATQVEMAVVSELEKIALPEGKQGEPGKSVTPDDVRPMLRELVAALPKPVDGKDGEPGLPGNSVVIDDVRPLLQEMVEALPKPKDADPTEVAALILEDVAKLIPVPADGKSVTLEEIMPLVDQAAAKKLPNLFLVNEEGMLVTVYANGDTKSIGKVRGDPGVRGASVMDGTIDEGGSLILRMSDGRILQTGIVRGESGTDGRDGTKGEPGRDAHEIQILPGIDESKSYIDGIVAYWRGGLIRSVRHTDPIVDGDILSAGWKVYLRGIAEEYEEQIEDGRYLEKTTIYTDGTEFKRRHKTVTPIHQGVWKEGVSYLKGDQVTWAGSTFIAQRDTSDKPETTDAFRLSTKRGRDGKDGKIDRPQSPVKLDPDKR